MGDDSFRFNLYRFNLFFQPQPDRQPVVASAGFSIRILPSFARPWTLRHRRYFNRADYWAVGNFLYFFPRPSVAKKAIAGRTRFRRRPGNQFYRSGAYSGLCSAYLGFLSK